ncbi:MAG: YraN family protein [Pyrinomonadaceae bacterium]|nr:YraN family protein [Pyrinomonadaceae bacterium]
MSEIIESIIQNNQEVWSSTSELGDFGENAAATFLVKNGFRLIASNFKIPIGRNRKGVAVTGELDLIAFENDVLCFIEVKTRSSDTFNSPLTAVDHRKQRQITRTARAYRKTFNINGVSFRYDVVSVLPNERKAPKIKLTREFWTEAKFKKNFWLGDPLYL